MNSQREQFESVFTVPYDVFWSDVREEYIGDPSLSGERYQGQWEGWQAATEQGVGEPVGEIQTYQSTGSHKSVTGILWYNGEPESGSKLYTYPPKPTDGDLTIDDYKEAFESHRKMVRKLDVLINGEERAAKQASLCDLVGQIEKEGLVFPSKPTGGGVPDDVGGGDVIALEIGEPWEEKSPQEHIADGWNACRAVLLATQQPKD